MFMRRGLRYLLRAFPLSALAAASGKPRRHRSGTRKKSIAALVPLREREKFEMNLRLPRRVYDSETNLHYNYYRDYDAVLGRCATPDPLELIVGMNPYAVGRRRRRRTVF
jgi:RHS repeat-associated protein